MMKRILRFIILTFLLYTAYTGYSVWTYGENNNNSVADAAIVLGAAQWNGSPSPVFEGRLKQGIELYKNGQVDQLIVTGGSGDGSKSSEGEVGKKYAVQKGIPEKDIIVEDQSLATYENLANTESLVKGRSIESFLLVSDAFHLKRAVSIAEELKMDVKAVATQYSAYQSMETKLPFFLQEWAYYLGDQLI
ncbi:YdcF family protein [Halobacillus seohaensis]|uniref:YdcF family protein n=1 Tax=Halobacillus seohaensis TaxID=447421 RepID=A0ABW2ENY9_9BACI